MITGGRGATWNTPLHPQTYFKTARGKDWPFGIQAPLALLIFLHGNNKVLINPRTSKGGGGGQMDPHRFLGPKI